MWFIHSEVCMQMVTSFSVQWKICAVGKVVLFRRKGHRIARCYRRTESLFEQGTKRPDSFTRMFKAIANSTVQYFPIKLKIFWAQFHYWIRFVTFFDLCSVFLWILLDQTWHRISQREIQAQRAKRRSNVLDEANMRKDQLWLYYLYGFESKTNRQLCNFGATAPGKNLST